MRITAPRTQDERLVPLLDTPPKWLPGIDVGIQINFHFKIFFLFNWNILFFLSSVFKFPLDWIGFSCLQSLGWILFYFIFLVCLFVYLFFCGQWDGLDARVVWSFCCATHSNPLDFLTRLVVYTLFHIKPSVPHYQSEQSRATTIPVLHLSPSVNVLQSIRVQSVNTPPPPGC